jgi:hypothetical protein
VFINNLGNVRKLLLCATLQTFFAAFDLLPDTSDLNVSIHESLLNILELLPEIFDSPVSIRELLLNLLELLPDTFGSSVSIHELVLKRLKLLHSGL